MPTKLHDPVRVILDQKGSHVWSIPPDASVFEAIALMSEKHVGALLVLEGASPAGVISERDYARKVILQGKSSKATLVRDIMSSPVICTSAQSTVDECMQLMTHHRIRHLPVLGANEEVAGVVSVGDLVKWIISAQQATIEQLHNYISGRYPA